MAASTWTWIGTTNDPSIASNWTLTAGSGNSKDRPQSGDTAIISGGTTVPPLLFDTTAGTATFDLTGNGTIDFGNDSADPSTTGIDQFSTINASGTATTLSISGPFTNAGTIEVTGTNDSLSIPLTAGASADGMLVNYGQIIVGQGDTLIMTGGTLNSTGEVAVNGGTAVIGSSLTGLDNFAIGTGGTLELTQSGTNALTEIGFTGTTGLLKIDAPTGFVGGINQFALGDTLDLGVFNAATVIFDGAGDITVIGSNGIFTASDNSPGPLDGFDNQGTFTLTATGGLAGNLNVVEGSGGDTVLTALSPTTWEWEDVTSSWSLVSGPGNGWGQPQPGDTAIITAGTLFTGTQTFLTSNTVEVGGTGGTVAAFFAVGDTNVSEMNPTLDGNSVIDSAVPGANTPETSLLDAAGIFVNDGQIDADGHVGSSFTIAIFGTTPDGGAFQPGYFINHNQIEVAAGNTMTITVAGTSELLNASEIEVDGGTLIISVATNAIDGGYAPGTGVIVIDGGGIVETNVGYAASVSGIPPVYAFADAMAGNTLKIDNPGSFGGAIFGFGQNDTIDFGSSLAVGTVVYNSTSGILELESAGGSILASVQLASGNFLAAGTQVGTFVVSGTVAGPFDVRTGADGDTILTTAVADFISYDTSGTWQTGTLWAGGSAPGTLDTALIGDGAKTPFTFTTGGSPVTIGALALASDPTLLQITSSTTVSPYPIRLFAGTLEITANQTLTASAISQSAGTLMLDAGSVLDLTGSAVDGVTPNYNIVGAANGTISVANTGTLAIEFGGGTVLVNGATLDAGIGQSGGNGGHLNIGYEGGGTPAVFTVQNSGTHAGVVTDTYALVASDPTSFGVLTLDGNVTWTDQIDPHDTIDTRGFMVVGYNGQSNNSGTLTPAFSGTATLVVEGGATLTDQSYAEIGQNFDSAGSVLVDNALWNVGTATGGFLDVGLGGEGTLFVTDSGTVAVGKPGSFFQNGTTFSGSGINLGGSSYGDGTLVVSGAGALVTDKAGMNVGQAGTGDVQVLNGGTILLTGTSGISIGVSIGASGDLLVSGTDPSTGAPALVTLAATAKGITAGASGQGELDVESGGTIWMNGTGGIAIGQSIDGSGLVIVNGPNALINEGTATTGIGIAQAANTSGTLLVENGGTILLNGTGGISDGAFAGSTGLIDIDGPNSLINEGTAGSGMAVGASGSGTLVIENGGTFALQSTGTNAGIGVGQTAGSTGLIVVTGTSSLLTMNTPAAGLAVGGFGQGTLEVESGGSVSVAGLGLNIGVDSGGGGTVTVSGTGSAIVLTGTGGAINVGSPGSGVLNIDSGASVSASAGVFIAENTGTASGVVLVNAGTLTDAGPLTVGSSGSGTLEVLSHGLVQLTGTNGVDVGGFSGGANGFLLINGGGTLSDTGGFFSIGGSNVAGFVVVEGGGTLITGSGTSFADINATGTGAASALVTGGTWVSNGSIIVGDTGTGGLEIGSNGLLNAGTHSVVIGQQTGGAGTLTVLGGTLLAGALTLDNDINGGATGSLSVGGTVNVSALSVNANSTISVGSGALSVSGNATIGGIGSGAALNVTGGNVTTAMLTIAQTPGSAGTITVSGGTLDTTGLLTIANSGNGLLTVNIGGTLIAAGGLQVDPSVGTPGTGTLVVNGGSVSVSNGFSVGNGGTASVIVEAGGTLTASGSTTFGVGSPTGGTASVTVDDGYFSTSGAPLFVGFGGNGSMLVENGGTVITTRSGGGPGVDINAGIGDQASVTVTGTGSTWDASGSGSQFIVGDSGSGSLTISAGGIVNVGSNIVDIGNQTGGTGTVVVSGGTLTETGLTGAIDIGLGGSTGELTIDSNGLVSVTGGVQIGSAGTILLSGGTLSALVSSSGTIGGFGVLSGQLTNNGSVVAAGGTLDVSGSILGSGTIVISGNASFESDGALGSGQAVTFASSANPANLILGTPQGTNAFSIANWQNGDAIVFNNAVTVTGDQWFSGGTLDVFTTGGTYDFTNVSLAGGTTPVFTTGSDYVELVSCFAAGTCIRTTRGEVKVEELREGDIAITGIDGSHSPIIWIGHRDVDCAHHPDPESVWPVRIKAGAFGRGMPKRTLTLSPDHAVYVNEVLVPVKHLINGTTITQVKVERVTYYHVELPRHDVLLADGMPAESYLDVGDRANFANGGAVVRLHIDLAHHWEAGGCAPLVIYGAELDGARTLVAAAAQAASAARKPRTRRSGGRAA